MSDVPQEDIKRRRTIEDRAIKLGSERVKLREQLRKNAQAIAALLEQAVANGIHLESFARLAKVSRQSLYDWRRNELRDEHPAQTTTRGKGQGDARSESKRD